MGAREKQTASPGSRCRGAGIFTRIFGPGRSASTAANFPSVAPLRGTAATRSMCSSAAPCEKLTRATSTPARRIASSVVGRSVAGPRVATIFVRRGIGGSAGRLVEEERSGDLWRMDGMFNRCATGSRCVARCLAARAVVLRRALPRAWPEPISRIRRWRGLRRYCPSLLWLVLMLRLVRPCGGNARNCRANPAQSAAWLAELCVHVAVAFHLGHGWSHAAALNTPATVGGYGDGIFVNYAFVLGVA